MQNSSDYNKSIDYFLAYLREALQEKVFSITEDTIRQIIRDEFSLLLKKKSKNKFNSQVFSSRIGWLKGDNTLIKLYELLISHGFIICNFQIFKTHFLGDSSKTEPIIWLSYNKWFVYLFDILLTKKFITKRGNLHQILEEHFLDKHGNKFKNGCLRGSLNQMKSSNQTDVIDEIIDLLLKCAN